MVAVLLSILSALCFGAAAVTSKVGLRSLDARAGAAISVPTATAFFVLASPFTLDIAGFTLVAALLFALVGLFFPALVTILTFKSNDVLGPTVTSAVSGIAPLFALAAAALFLGERIPAEAAVAAVGVGVGVCLLSWNPKGIRPGFAGWALLLPLAGAMLRGVAQVTAKAGLLLWPNPFAASLLGYCVSSAVVISADRLSRTRAKSPTWHSIVWFAITGVLNGGAVLLMYVALSKAPVSTVAPVVASFPLVTALISGAALREEALTLRVVAGAAVTVAAIVYLVAA
jgi:drug/metabolite transporter (DMT)-like permease